MSLKQKISFTSRRQRRLNINKFLTASDTVALTYILFQPAATMSP